MKAYSIDFRKKILQVYEQGGTSIRKLAARFYVSKGFVMNLIKLKRETGDIQPLQQGGSQKSVLATYKSQLIEMVEKYPDYTLSEYCEYWRCNYKESVSPSMMCRELKKLNLTRKKKLFALVRQIQKE
jgi:transposase